MERERVNFKAFIFDLDGTIYLGERLIRGADEVVQKLRDGGGRVVFLSNKPLDTREAYAAKLARLGIPAAPEDVINSSFVATRYLLGRMPGARLHVIGEPPFLEELRRAGFATARTPEETDAVVIAFDRTLDYGKLHFAHLAVRRRGAVMIATNPDAFCPADDDELPDAGGTIALLEATTGRRVEVVVGKPSPIMTEAILNHVAVPASACLMVGDRVETDIRMGHDAGMGTALVLTGATTREQAGASDVRADYVLESVRDLLHKI
ncbi:MAG: HAD-IIA family hydrolase [Candidatus Latescibacteria bacterium]|nr:HAD-IIA family hydrolase [Candidatus Latescibacterota bacterium]